DDPDKDKTPPPMAKDSNLAKIASMRDGVVVVIGTEIKEGEKVPPDRIVTAKVGNDVKKFRRLKPGDRVEPGQLLGLLDDRLARDDYAIKKRKVAVAEAELAAATKIREEAQVRYNTQERLRGLGARGATSEEDVRAAKLLWETKTFEAICKEQAVGVAQ